MIFGFVFGIGDSSTIPNDLAAHVSNLGAQVNTVIQNFG